MVGWGSGRWSWEGWLSKWGSAMSGKRWWEGRGVCGGNAVVPHPACDGKAERKVGEKGGTVRMCGGGGCQRDAQAERKARRSLLHVHQTGLGCELHTPSNPHSCSCLQNLHIAATCLVATSQGGSSWSGL